MARTLGSLGRVFEAIKLIRLAWKKDPGPDLVVKLHYYAGVFYTMVGNFANAIDCFKRALANDPKNTDSLNNIAMVYFIIGNIDDWTRFFGELVTTISQKVPKCSVKGNNGLLEVSETNPSLHEWIIDHVMSVFTIGALSLRNMDETYSNLQKTYSAYRKPTTTIPLDNELLHFNLATHLTLKGAIVEASWHYRYSAKLGLYRRLNIAGLRSCLLGRLLHSDALRRKAALESRLDLLKQLRDEVNIRIERTSYEALRFNCMSLGADLERRNPYFQPFDSMLIETIRNVCIGLQMNDDSFPTVSRRRSIGIVMSGNNNTSSKGIVPIIDWLSFTSIPCTIFMWSKQPTAGRTYKRCSVVELPFDNISKASKLVVLHEFPAVIFLDAHLDLRTFLLSSINMNCLKIFLLVRRFDLGISAPVETNSVVIKWMPNEPPPFIQETDTIGGISEYLGSLCHLQAIVINSLLENEIHQVEFQGELLFNEYHYVLIAGTIQQIPSEFDSIILKLLKMDESIRIIAMSGTTTDSITADSFYNRLQRLGVELKQVMVFQRMKHSLFLKLLNQMDLILDPMIGLDGAMMTFVESLFLSKPIVGYDGDLSHHFKLTDFKAKNDDEYVELSIALLDKNSSVSNMYMDQFKKVRFQLCVSDTLHMSNYFHAWSTWLDRMLS